MYKKYFISSSQYKYNYNNEERKCLIKYGVLRAALSDEDYFSK